MMQMDDSMMRMTKNTNSEYANDDDAVEENDDKMLVK